MNRKWREPQEEDIWRCWNVLEKDERIYAWDLWNEPGNSNRHDMSIPYIRRVFEAARAMDPIQPLTAGVWSYPEDYGSCEAADVEPVQRLALDESDIITFHQYEGIERVKRVVSQLKKRKPPDDEYGMAGTVYRIILYRIIFLCIMKKESGATAGACGRKKSCISFHGMSCGIIGNCLLTGGSMIWFDTFFTAYDEGRAGIDANVQEKVKSLPTKGIKNERA